uniref:Uncharacterized protein n=1 Tax=Kalanchoe fedtschenkoi TaxID=63787 RepID=A0A7N1A4H8_KALFE
MPRMAADHGHRLYGVRKGAWSEEEDALLRECIDKYGEGKWHQVPLKAGLNRCRKSCRLRWLNYLKPNIKRGEFSMDEADLIIRLHKLLGNRWSLIAGRLPGRTANDVKNYWNTHLGKKTMLRLQALMNSAAAADYQTKVIKPRPRTFSKTLVQCMRSGQQQQQGLHFCTNNGSKSSTIKDDAVDLISGKDDDGVDKQIQWWKSLLDDQLSDQELAALASGSCGLDEEEQAGYELPQPPVDDRSGYKIYEERPKTDFTNELSFDIELWDCFTDDDQWQTSSGPIQGL